MRHSFDRPTNPSLRLGRAMIQAGGLTLLLAVGAASAAPAPEPHASADSAAAASAASMASNPVPSVSRGAAGQNYFVVPACRAVRSHLLNGFQETVPIWGTCGVPATAQSVSFTLSEFDAGFDGIMLVQFTGSNLLFQDIPKINWRGGQNRSQHFILQLGTAGSLNVSAGLAAGVVSFTVDVDGYFQ